ncbi:MAG TPA: 3-deoxy-7-phosphoheptulonate synthase [Burkholderiales bacterium]|nr:3-deoxy-7-phosphoheptulonate synthase [Burkholderiales bacterium]
MAAGTDDLRVKRIDALIPAAEILEAFPIAPAAARVVGETRRALQDILHGRDDRLIVIIGPCSVHDVEAAREYGGRLLEMKRRLAADLLVLMRVYFEKPRTTVGWKGLINDPGLDGSFRINDGLKLARGLLLDLNASGVPVACEFLDMVTPQYIADLVSWGAIGARTTESQIHRELASGLSCPVGFKNGTDGNIRIAIDGIRAARVPHRFIGVTKTGECAIVATSGNADCHIVLRGGTQPNYDAASVEAACSMLSTAALTPNVMIDLSHANSSKRYEKQMDGGHDVAAQIVSGDTRIIGVMAESHLKAGRQDLAPGKTLVYGQSITDACLGWEESAQLLETLAAAAARRRDARRSR